MIIKEQTSSIEQIGNVTNQSEFKMRTSQKAFQILSSLYSDKPLAIVRELGCNAMDSHIASGQSTKPFHIHVPNSLEPWLTIQDFGTGISHENIYEIYSVYFASTKTNTNSQVGMLGLGSKSPFCYTDNFTITSIHDQVKRIYNAYFNADGMPTISLASQENTIEGNGVAIQIPIKASDFSEFSQAVWKAFRFFDVKPTITGGKVEWDNDLPDFEGTFWKSYSKVTGSYAIMGGVTYPIDVYKTSDEHYEILRKAGLVIQFNIGELDVTPSRESLMYHDWVVKAINAKVDLVKKDFLAKVESTIRDSHNLMDAMKALYLLKDQWSFLNSTLINGKVLWKNIDISEPRRAVKVIAPSIKCFSKSAWGRKKWTESESAQFHNHAEWYADDLKRGAIKRIVNHVRFNSNSSIAINLVPMSEMNDLIRNGFPASAFKLASSLPSPTTNRATGIRNSRPKGIINIYEIGAYYRQQWISYQFDLSTGTAPKYYITKDTANWSFNAGSLKDSNGNPIIHATSKESLRDILSYLKIKDDDVRMVSKNNAKFLDKVGSTPLSEFINKAKINIDKHKMQIARMLDGCVIRSLVKNKKFIALPDDNQFKIFVNECNDVLNDVKKYDNFFKYIPRGDEKKTLTFPSNMVRLQYLACSSWQVGVECVLDAILETEQSN